MNTLPNLKDKKYGGAWSIHDPIHIDFISSAYIRNPSVKKFLEDYYNWCQKFHTINGFSKFNHLAYANGTTEVFDKFYHRHMTRRLRLWKGEYFYHQIQAKLHFDNNFAWIDESPIMENDVVVVSMPFSDTGLIPHNYKTVMEECCNRGVPVLVDMAYLNLSVPMTYDVDFECITTLATSLSKFFPVETDRIGMRMERHLVDDTLNAYTTNQVPYLNNRSVGIGHAIIQNFDANHIVKKYQSLQKELCQKLNLVASNCVIFGIDNQNLYPEYNRGGKTNRLCFSRIWDKRI